MSNTERICHTVSRYSLTNGDNLWPLRTFMISENLLAVISPSGILLWKKACRWYSFSKSWSENQNNYTKIVIFTLLFIGLYVHVLLLQYIFIIISLS